MSEDEASVIYLRRAGGLGANIEVVEMDLETRDVKILVTVNELNTVIRNISPKKRIVHPELEERIRSVKYVPDTNQGEGKEYKWLDAHTIVLWVKTEKNYVVSQYDILEKDKKFILYGTDLSTNGDVLVCYQRSRTMSDPWITYHNFYFYDLEFRKQTREYVYTFRSIMRGAEDVIFERYEDGVLIWGEENQNYYYIYDSKRDVAVKIWLPGKKIAAIL